MTRIETTPPVSRSAVVLLAIAALVFALLPAMSASADHIDRRQIDDPCPDEPPQTFPDADGTTHEEAINCAAFWGIVLGYDDGDFRPGENLNRAQMASVIARMMETAGYDFEEDPPDAFDDTDGHHKENIDKLAAAGVVDGTGDREYSPHRTVNRAQMAKFIHNALGSVAGEFVAEDDDYFDDIDEDHWAAEHINALASIGVVEGVDHRTYGPNVTVRRGQTTAFVIRGADYLFAEGHWPDWALFGQSYVVEPRSATTMTAGAVRQYSVEAPEGTALNVRLFPAADVNFVPGAGIIFRDVAIPSRVADHNASAARIIAVNGTAITPMQQILREAPASGELTFVIQSTQAASVVPVVWTDSPGGTGGRLDLDNDGRPVESFGVGAAVTVIMNEAPTGSATPVVQGWDVAAGMLAGTDGRTYRWGIGDVFRFKGTEITRQRFEDLVSINDTLEVTYSRTGSSTFDILDHTLQTPAAPSARLTGSGQTSDVLVTFTLPFVNAVATTYTLRGRDISPTASDTCTFADSSFGNWNDAGNVPLSRIAISHPYTELDDGCWIFRIEAASVPGTGTATSPAASGNSPASNQVQTPGTIDDVEPVIDNAFVDEDAAPQGTLSEGDEHVFEFSRNMQSGIANGWYRVSDPNGTIAEIVCEGNQEKTPNAECDYSNASSGLPPLTQPSPATLTVTLTAAPHVIQAGSQSGAQYPATLVALSDHWRGSNGVKVTFQGSDRVINVQ